eukprot:jgi/Undpi1/12236/HiC_scaffold_5.g01912.m1
MSLEDGEAPSPSAAAAAAASAAAAALLTEASTDPAAAAAAAEPAAATTTTATAAATSTESAAAVVAAAAEPTAAVAAAVGEGATALSAGKLGQQQQQQQEQPLLRAWHRRGNPFRTLGPAGAPTSASDEAGVEGQAGREGGGAAGGGGGGGEGGEKETVAGVGLGRLPIGTDHDDDPDWGVVAAVGVEAGEAEGGRAGGGRDGGRSREELEVEDRRYGSGWVVTQAALNGVARYAGHALQIMALVRPAAPSAFEGLRQLVDLYMYCAFTLFCPQWAIDALYGFGDEELVASPLEQESFSELKSFMSRVSHELNASSSDEPGAASRAPSTHHSPERSPIPRERKTPTSANNNSNGRGGEDDRVTGGGNAPKSLHRSRSRSTATPTRSNKAFSGGGAGAAAGAGGSNGNSDDTSGEVTLAGAMAHLRERVGRASLDVSPATAAAGSGGGGGGGGRRGVGDSPPRSRAGSATGGQGLFSRRPTRHPTPRAPLPLPACMAPPQKPGGDGKGLDGLLLQGSEALWGGSGGDGGGGGGGGGGGCGGDAAEETMEWRSMGQRVVAVESCLFVLQVLKAARRRTIGLGLLPASQRAAVDAYVLEVEQAAAQLRIFAYKAQAMGLTGSGGIASAIESQSWTLKTFRNDASPYVEKCASRCLSVHRAIFPPTSPPPPSGPRVEASAAPRPYPGTSSAPSAALAAAAASSAERAGVAAGGRKERAASPPLALEAAESGGAGAAGGNGVATRHSSSSSFGTSGGGSGGGGGGGGGIPALVPMRAREMAWRGVVDAALMSLLRGFSRVKRCSTEGRALMSMDLQALTLGLEDPAAAQASKAHVHAYVNAFYFGEDDLHNWIKCGEGGAASKVLRKRRVKDLVSQVESLYLPWNTAEGSKPPPSFSAPSKEVKGAPAVAGVNRAGAQREGEVDKLRLGEWGERRDGTGEMEDGGERAIYGGRENEEGRGRRVF